MPQMTGPLHCTNVQNRTITLRHSQSDQMLDQLPQEVAKKWLQGCLLKKTQKSRNIWATFVRDLIGPNFKLLPNLVTLVTVLSVEREVRPRVSLTAPNRDHFAQVSLMVLDFFGCNCQS